MHKTSVSARAWEKKQQLLVPDDEKGENFAPIVDPTSHLERFASLMDPVYKKTEHVPQERIEKY